MPLKTTPPSNEIWIAGNARADLLEILRGLGKTYNLDVWYNGVKIWSEKKTTAESDAGKLGQDY